MRKNAMDTATGTIRKIRRSVRCTPYPTSKLLQTAMAAINAQAYRWLFDIGVPRFNSDGSFAGYIGSCIDVTDHKLAEEAMADTGSRLMEAPEEERTWIGRELHEDINQRLALAVIELEQWGEEHSKPEVEGHEHIAHVKQRLADLGHDVQALSHRLYSSA
jgi:signal transduction histidine kinase